MQILKMRTDFWSVRIFCNILSYGLPLFDQSAVLQQDFNIRALDFFQNDLEQLLFHKGKFFVGEWLFVNGIIAGTQQFPHVVLAAPDFRGQCPAGCKRIPYRYAWNIPW